MHFLMHEKTRNRTIKTASDTFHSFLMAIGTFLAEFFDFIGWFYQLAKPVILVQLVLFLFLPLMVRDKGDPRETARALFSYMMQVVAIILMTISILPTVIAVLAQQELSVEISLSLLLLFATGGILFLWCNQNVRDLPDEARIIPELIYRNLLKVVGYLCILAAALMLAFSTSFDFGNLGRWWIQPVILILYGGLLCWITSGDPKVDMLFGPQPDEPVKAKTTSKKRTTTRKKKK